MSLVVGQIHGGAVSLVADTKITRQHDPTRTRRVLQNALPKLVILGDDLCVGFAGNDPEGLLQKLVSLRDRSVEAVLEVTSALCHASFVIAALGDSPTLWQVGDGRQDDRSEIGRAWAGDQTAYEGFQARWTEWPQGAEPALRLLSSLQWVINLGQVPSVGGYHTRVATTREGFRFARDTTKIHPDQLRAVAKVVGADIVLELIAEGGGQASWFTLQCASGTTPTIGALAYFVPQAGIGFAFPHSSPWEPVEVAAGTMPELIEKLRSIHGQELQG